MRSGVCGQRGSGGKALSVAALAMPTRAAPNSLARRFTVAASSSVIVWSWSALASEFRLRACAIPDAPEDILSLNCFAWEVSVAGLFRRGRAPARGDVTVDRPFEAEALPQG